MQEVEFWVDLKDWEGFSSHSKDSVLVRGRCLGEDKVVSMFREFLRNC